MAGELYLVPVVGGTSIRDPRRPKYLDSDASGQGRGGALSARYAISQEEYGYEGWIFVAPYGISAADDLTLRGFADAYGLPTDLDAFLTPAQVAVVQQKLEAINLPALWIDTTWTWRLALRVAFGMVRLMRRFHDRHGPVKFFGGSVTLATTFGSLPAAVRTNLIWAADSLELDRTGANAGTTIRVLWKGLGDQTMTETFHLGPLVI